MYFYCLFAYRLALKLPFNRSNTTIIVSRATQTGIRAVSTKRYQTVFCYAYRAFQLSSCTSRNWPGDSASRRSRSVSSSQYIMSARNFLINHLIPTALTCLVRQTGSGRGHVGRFEVFSYLFYGQRNIFKLTNTASCHNRF